MNFFSKNEKYLKFQFLCKRKFNWFHYPSLKCTLKSFHRLVAELFSNVLRTESCLTGSCNYSGLKYDY